MTEAMTIRQAGPGDFEAVDQMMRRSYPVLLRGDYAPSVMVTALPRIARAQMKLLKSGKYYLLEDESGEILAAGGWSRNDPRGLRMVSGLGHIRHVVTDCRQVRRGLGRRLMGHVMGLAREAGITRFDCMSTLTAEPFYAALGFKRLGAVELSLAPGIRFPAVQMICE